MTEVIVAGAGPTGMMIGAELTLAGVDVTVVERRPTAELAGSRAGGFHARTIEILDQRGIADRFLSAGQIHQGAAMGSKMFDVADFPTRHPYTLGLWQNHIERILAEWVDELGVRIDRGREITGFTQSEAGVKVTLADGQLLEAQYLVGADGGRSVIRKAAGIDFAGWDATVTALIAEVEVTEQPPVGICKDAVGIHGLNVMEDGHTFRVMTTEETKGSGAEPTLDELKIALRRVYGTDFGVHSPTWLSRFSDATRQAAAYRDRRVLLAGDAAHVHYPAGGQGIGLGIQDAVNLGWKLAQVVTGVSPEELLDTYHSERRPTAARVLKQTMVMGVLQRPDVRSGAVKDLIDDLMEIPEARSRVAGLLSGLDIRYDAGIGHPLLGRRMPDLDLDTPAGPTRVFELLHSARPVLLDFGAPGRIDIGPWTGRVNHVMAITGDLWQLPIVGEVSAPNAVLIRPDGHVVWIAEATLDGQDPAELYAALERWFGVVGPRPGPVRRVRGRSRRQVQPG